MKQDLEKPRASDAKRVRRERALARFTFRPQHHDESDAHYRAYTERKNAEQLSLTSIRSM